MFSRKKEVNNKNVLSDLTLVIPALVALELFAPLDPAETQFADVNLVWSPTPTPLLAANPNVLLTLIVEPVTTSVKTKSKNNILIRNALFLPHQSEMQSKNQLLRWIER